MNVAFTTLACPDWSIEQIVDAATTLGYDGVELRLLDGTPIDPVRDRARVERAVALCRARGLAVPAFDSSCRFNLPATAERDRQVAELLAWIALARALQVPIIRVFGGEQGSADPPSSDQEADDRVIRALRQAAPDAERAGVIIAVETHDAFSSARRVSRVLEAVGSTHVAALWDSHHPYRVGESVEQVIAALGPRIAHVHVKDARRQADGSWQLAPMGEGDVPVRDMIAALDRAGYDGYVAVEWEKKWHPELAEPEIALPQHIAWLRGLLWAAHAEERASAIPPTAEAAR
jgi:fatty-acyl-CoA synthase